MQAPAPPDEYITRAKEVLSIPRIRRTSIFPLFPTRFPTNLATFIPLPTFSTLPLHLILSNTHSPSLSRYRSLLSSLCFFSFFLFQPTRVFLPCFAHQSHRILLVFFSFVVCSSFSLSHSLVNIYLSYFLLLQGRLTLTFLTKLTGSWAPSVVTGSVERPTGSISSFCFPALLICPATPMPQGDAR